MIQLYSSWWDTVVGSDSSICFIFLLIALFPAAVSPHPFLSLYRVFKVLKQNRKDRKALLCE